jgi:hypothetical protein
MSLFYLKKHLGLKKAITMVAFAFMLLSFTFFANVPVAQAADVYTSGNGVSVNVVYNGVTTNVANYSTYYLSDPANFNQHQETLSAIDNLPSPVTGLCYGPYLQDVISRAIGAGNLQYITSIKYTGTDGFARTLDYASLMGARYYYPNLTSTWDTDNHTPGAGATNNPVRVYPILGVNSYQSRFITSTSSAQQDYANAIRFAYGQTAADVTTPNYTASYWMKGLCKIELTVSQPVGSATSILQPPVLQGSYKNGLSYPTAPGTNPVLPFADDASWRAAVTVVTVDDVSVNYSLVAGSLTINNTSLATGFHRVKVTATGYADNFAPLIIGNTPPALTFVNGVIDQGDNAVISFADTPAWEGAVTSVKVNGVSKSYTLDTVNNTITITAANGGWSSTGGYFLVTVQATGYDSALPSYNYTYNGKNYTNYAEVVSPAYLY